MGLNELLSKIDLCNNGYIFAPTWAEKQCAIANPQAVEFKGGRIFRKGFKPEVFPYIPTKKPVSFDPGYDAEEAILARQEADLFN